MAEQSRKIYISVHEFVDSWEKEVYELTNLDYFVYLLINELAGAVETGFLSRRNSGDYLQLHSEDIGTLAFNIGDSLQEFLELNCFGTCSLRCPLRMAERPDVGEMEERNRLLFDPLPRKDTLCKSKEQCLFFDIKKWVVVDTLLDFYQFDKGMVIEDNDKSLLLFADFISHLIVENFKKQNSRLLLQPDENASSEFETLINSSETDWDNHFEQPDEDDPLWEGDEWKYAATGTASILEQFWQLSQPIAHAQHLQRIFDRFSEFLTEFLGLDQIEELTIAEVQEFITMVVVHELIGEEEEIFWEVIHTFEKLIKFLDYNHNLELHPLLSAYLKQDFPEVLRTFRMANLYVQQFPLLDFLLSDQAERNMQLDGFFEVLATKGTQCELEDLHIKSRFETVEFNGADLKELRKGDILHVQISTDGQDWKIDHLEMIYPAKARAYLY